MKFVLAALLSSFLVADIGLASQTTGSLRGVVRDSSGAPVADATVAISGRSSSVHRVLTTAAAGEYRFAHLPPAGDYRLEISAEGFEIVLHEDVVVALGSDGMLHVELRPALAGEITVRGTAPLVDVTNATVSTNITSEQFNALPTRRDYQQLTALAPGVYFDARNAFNPTVNGATHLENDYIIEGLSTRDLRFGTSATNLTMNFVDEIQVITGSASAQYGRALGGIFNVITKSGSNEFRGDISAYYEDADWGEEAVTRVNRGAATSGLGHDRKDLALALSGPVKRDRVWLFAAVDPRRDVTPMHMADAAFGIDRTVNRIESEDVYALKVSAAPTSDSYLTITAFGNPRQNSGWLGRVRSDDAVALRTESGGSRNVTGRYHHFAGARVSIEAVVGNHNQDFSSRPDTEVGRTVPFQLDVSTGWVHGGFAGRSDDLQNDRKVISLKTVSALQRHELRAGIDAERNRYDNASRETGFAFVPREQRMSEETFDYSGTASNDALAAYVEDSLRIGNRTAVTVGLRWEQQVISSNRGVMIVDGFDGNGALIERPASDFTFDDNWSPRLGIVWDPTGRGRAKVYASAGRYFEAIPLQMNIGFFTGLSYHANMFRALVPQTSETWFNPAGSPINGNWVLFDTYDETYPVQPDGIAPDAKASYQDEFSVGGQAQIGNATVVGIRLLHRALGRVLDDRGVWDPSGTPRTATDYFLVNLGGGKYGMEYRRPERQYSALELTAQRRLTEHWQMISSLVLARERGDYDGLYEYSSGASSPHTGFAFDVPRFEEDSYGRLRGDRPHQFKLASSYTFPFGLTVSGSFIHSAGVPISALLGGNLAQGKQVVHLRPRGSQGRTPDVWNLDLHVEWRVPVPQWRDMSVSLIADVLNATDNHGVLEVDEVYAYRGMPGFAVWTAPENLDEWGFPKFDPVLPHSPYYKTPTRYQDPRAIQVGLRLRL